MSRSNAAEAKRQLAAIASLSAVLDRDRLDYWLFGGWAVDFWVGRITRDHDDVDVAIWQRDHDRIKAALEADGWRHTPELDEVASTSYRCGGALVEFTFVVSDDRDRVIIPMPDHPLVWSTEPFGDARRSLHGVSTRVMSLAILRAGKAVPREPDDEAAKDRADFDELSRARGAT